MARSDFRFPRGAYVRDLVTGQTGIIMSRMDSITGCDRYAMQPPMDKDGKVPDAAWLDDKCLEYDPKHAGEKLDLQLREEDPPG